MGGREARMTIQVFGIPNCGTCKKALKWLEENNLVYEFINTKEKPPSKEEVESWVKSLGAKSMRNTSGQYMTTLGTVTMRVEVELNI